MQAEIIDKPFYWRNTNGGRFLDKAPIELANIGDLKIREIIKKTVDGKVVETESYYVAGRVFREVAMLSLPVHHRQETLVSSARLRLSKPKSYLKNPKDPNRVYQVVNKKGALTEGRATMRSPILTVLNASFLTTSSPIPMAVKE